LTLKPKDEEFLDSKGIKLWNLPSDDEYRVKAEGSPIRAIVKDYLEEGTATRARSPKMMLKDIRFLNKHKILHRDIKSENYRNGFLVDFGSAWTEPHCIMGTVASDLVEDWKLCDLVMFDDLAQEQGFDKDIRGLPNEKYLKKLRATSKANA